jgi:hypothetical protein
MRHKAKTNVAAQREAVAVVGSDVGLPFPATARWHNTALRQLIDRFFGGHVFELHRGRRLRSMRQSFGSITKTS